MPARNLINLILKIFGVFFIKHILDGVARIISVIIFFPQYASHREAWFNLGVALPPVILHIFFVWLLLFRTAAVVRFFRLDAGLSDQPVPIRLHRSVFLSIAAILAGGWLIISAVPELFRELFFYYQERRMYTRMSRPDLSYVVLSFSKLLIGIILIILNRRIANLIEAKRRQSTWYWPARPPFVKKKAKKTARNLG